MTLRAIKIAALKLPRADRGKLALSLLSSLDHEDMEEVEQAWVEEFERRSKAYEKDPSSAIPAKVAMARARAALRK